jgi:8-oxo-dGTP pyrophosphatase MutT (NUDIX family)
MATDRFQHDDQLRRQIAANLDQFEHQHPPGETLAGAAVALVVSASEESEACLLLTMRSAKLKKHPNQFALPGGKIDSGETIDQTALRELHEELGIVLSPDNILGRLDDFATRSGFRISPVVVWNDSDQAVVPNPDEVASVYRIPLHELLLPQVTDIITEDGGDPILTLTLPSVGHRMYTPTASIIYQFREVALLAQSTRVSHYEQPKFAWK